MVFEGADVTETAKGAIAIALEEAAKVCEAQAMEEADRRDEVPEDSLSWPIYNHRAFISAKNAAAIRRMIKD